MIYKRIFYLKGFYFQVINVCQCYIKQTTFSCCFQSCCIISSPKQPRCSQQDTPSPACHQQPLRGSQHRVLAAALSAGCHYVNSDRVPHYIQSNQLSTTEVKNSSKTINFSQLNLSLAWPETLLDSQIMNTV